MKNDVRGQMLIEMIVVIGVVVILTTGIIAGTSMSLSRTQGNQIRSSALQYAQEGIELTRQKRDAGWTAFVNDQGTTESTLGIYTRSISLTLENTGLADERMLVDVVVSWGDATQTENNVELKTTLTQWK